PAPRARAESGTRPSGLFPRWPVNQHGSTEEMGPTKKGPPMGFPEQQQQVPGRQSAMDPVPDCGESSYRGSGKLTGKRAVITGGDSGIGRAVAIAYAREGADVLVSYLNEDDDAAEVAQLVTDAGRRCVLVPGDLSDPAHCRSVIDRAVSEFDG